ncbi:MAG: hypothetical protein KDD50_01500, partial [Bdellovibrionales bacterium]|nr:hypothetical protein [Bdellovibrionales bacterium]
VVIKGADHVMAKKDLLPGLRSWKFGVEVTVLQPVQTMGMNMDDRLSLKDLVRSQMVLAFDDGEKVKDAFVNVLHQNDLRQKELSQEELLK